MAGLTTAKSVCLGLLLAIAFSSFILCIININHQIVYAAGAPAVTAAWLAFAIIQVLYIVFQLVTRMRGAINKVAIVFGIHSLVTLAYLALGIALSVLSFKNSRYCPPGPERIASTCRGQYQALLALIWLSFAFNVLYLTLLFLCASTFGGFGVPEGDLHSEEDLERRAVLEKSGH